MIFVALLLDKYRFIKTNYSDLKQALTKYGASRFCFDFGFLNHDYINMYSNFALAPLDKDFACKRTLFYGDGKKISINYKFGLFEDDLINIDLPHIEINESNYKDYGVIISKSNDYFDIINSLTKHFGYVDNDNDKSFILSNSELMNFALVPFTLSVDENDIVLENVEKEMTTNEFDAFIAPFVVDDSFL